MADNQVSAPTVEATYCKEIARTIPRLLALGIGCLAAVWAVASGGDVNHLGRWSLAPSAGLAQNLEPAPEPVALPATKPVTVLVEGEPQTITMQLYQQAGGLLMTYSPSAICTSEACDPVGCFGSFPYDDLGAAVYPSSPN